MTAVEHLVDQLDQDQPAVLNIVDRDQEWAEWGRAMDGRSFLDPLLDWLERRPVCSSLMAAMICLAVVVAFVDVATRR